MKFFSSFFEHFSKLGFLIFFLILLFLLGADDTLRASSSGPAPVTKSPAAAALTRGAIICIEVRRPATEGRAARDERKERRRERDRRGDDGHELAHERGDKRRSV